MRNPIRLLSFLQENPDFCLPEEYGNFAKAYTRYMYAFRPTKDLRSRINALRCLDVAMRRSNPNSKHTDVTRLNAAILNEASAIIKEHFGARTAYVIGVHLEDISVFLSKNRLVVNPIHWSNPIPYPSEERRIGTEANAARERKLPTQGALDAAAALFHTAQQERDIITTACIAVLLAAPMRIHELLTVPENCEIYETSKNGKQAYAFRWQAGKGADPAPKWLNSDMAPVAQEAIARIRKLTHSARAMARWYENNPSKIYLPTHLEHLRGKDLNRHEITSILGFKDNKSVGYFLKPAANKISNRSRALISNDSGLSGGKIPFERLERLVIDMLPRGFPWLSKELQVKYSDALFIVPLNLLHSSKGTCLVMFQVITRQMIKNDLSGVGNIFDRNHCVDELDDAVRMNSHQARHLLNTLALTNGMSQLDTAKWSGRKNIHQNRYYDHRTPEQMLQLIRDSVGDSTKLLGPLSEVPKKLPITRQEFSLHMVPTAILTVLGRCIHDYATVPCELINDCITCHDHVFIKGETSTNSAARELLKLESGLLDTACAAGADGQYGAGRWEQHHAMRVERLRGLVDLYDDETIPDGTVIQLAPAKKIRDGSE
jgi:hypothetical protein